MFNLWPQALIPRGLTGFRRHQFAILATSLTLLALGALVHLLPESGMLQRAGTSLAGIRELAHPSWLVCPFCGGTRAFVASCELRLADAAALNLIAVYVFVHIACLLPFRLFLFFGNGTSTAAGAIRRFLAVADGSRLNLGIASALFFLQVALHFTGVMHWQIIDLALSTATPGPLW